MNDDYVHHDHPYTPYTDEFGMTLLPCKCGAQPMPGGRECVDCLLVRCQAPGFVPSLPERHLQRFPSRLVDVDPPVISKEAAK